MKSKYILLLSFIFFTILQFLFSLGTSPLSDDIGNYIDVIKLRNGEISTYDVYKELFNDPNRYTRPFSAITFGTVIVLSSFFSNNMFFLWGILWIISCYLIYKGTLKLFNNKEFSTLVVLLILLFPLSSSTQFSPVMQTGFYSVFSFIITILLIQSLLIKKKLTYIFIIVVNSSTHLFYEMNLFLTPLLILLVWIVSNKKYYDIFMIVILPIIIAFSYKLFFVKFIYPNHFDYSSSKVLLDFDKVKDTPIALIKLFTTDTLYIIIKSFEAISLYDIWEFSLLALGILLSILTSIFIKPKKLITKTSIGILILFFLLTIVVFFISNYPPIAFGFENRILLWVRISSALLFAVLLNNLLFLTESKKYLNSVARFSVFLIIFSGVVTVISQKNSWILAANYNKNIVRNLTKSFPKNQENIKVLYLMDKEKKKYLITDEATLEASYEISAALKLYTPQAKFNPNNIIIVNPTSYSLYQIGNIQFNKRLASEYISNDNGISIGKTTMNYPFYIYNERDNSVYLINNKKDFRLK